MWIDRRKVVQTLINLLDNAKRAYDGIRRLAKPVFVRIRRRRSSQVVIEVADQETGIPEENLTRILFNGFTTWEDGHGFGLHSGALAAQEMGGSLSAHCYGAGWGTVFTLVLPLEPARQAPAEA